MLAEIRAMTPETGSFLLRFVISGKRRRGAIKLVSRALYGFTPDTQLRPKEGTQGKFLYKEHDALPIIDQEAGSKLLTPLISHIIQYNSFRVVH